MAEQEVRSGVRPPRLLRRSWVEPRRMDSAVRGLIGWGPGYCDAQRFPRQGYAKGAHRRGQWACDSVYLEPGSWMSRCRYMAGHGTDRGYACDIFVVWQFIG